MTEFRIEVDIPAHPDRVWAVLCDVESWPDWTTTVTRIQRLNASPLAVGSRFRIYQPKLLPAIWQITEFDESARTITWVTRSPGIQVTASHVVVPSRDSNGATATLSLNFSGFLGPLVARLTSKLNHRYLAIEVAGLKQRSTRTAL